MKKKIIIIAVIVFLLLALGVGGYFIFGNKDKKDDKAKSNTKSKTTITITFDADGGTEVEPMKVKKGEKFELPKTEKKGYFFQGWFDGDVYYSDEDTDKLEKDTTLKALWANPDTPEDEVELKVVFDSKGGSKVKDMTFKCSDGVATIKNLPKSKKDSYDFLSWEDKHGKSILDGAKIMCDESSLKLYAVWEKAESKYSCPEGYSLKDTNKCVKTTAFEKYCTDGWKLINGECVNPKATNLSGKRTCPSKTYGGWTGTGTYYEAGRGYCGYEELPSYTGSSQQCSIHGGTLAANNHCYKHIEIDYKTECEDNEKRFEGQALAPGSNPGCYPVKAASKKCPDGYTANSTYGDCAIIKDATLE